MLNLGPRDRVAAFDVDAQYCFTEYCPDELPVPGALHIVNELNRQAGLAGFRLGSKDAHPVNAVWEATHDRPVLTPVTGHVNADLYWPRHGVPGTKGFDLLEGLPAVREYDFFVWKGIEPDMHPYGACFHDLSDQRSTGAIEFLRDRKVQVVVVGGLALDYCVKVTALQLASAGFRVVVNQGASRGLSPESSAIALQEMDAAGVELVASADELQVC